MCTFGVLSSSSLEQRPSPMISSLPFRMCVYVLVPRSESDPRQVFELSVNVEYMEGKHELGNGTGKQKPLLCCAFCSMLSSFFLVHVG